MTGKRRAIKDEPELPGSVMGTFGATPLPAVEATPFETPEDKSNTRWHKTRQKQLRDAAESSRRSKIRHDVYREMGYPQDGDGEAEREIERRGGLPVAGYGAVIAAAMVAAGVDTGGGTDGERVDGAGG